MDAHGSPMDGPIQHLALSRFPRALTEEEKEEMSRRIRAWPEQIGGFVRLRFGQDMSGGPEATTTPCSSRDMERYFPHPVHRAFADWVHVRGSQEIVVDFPIRSDTRFVGD